MLSSASKIAQIFCSLYLRIRIQLTVIGYQISNISDVYKIIQTKGEIGLNLSSILVFLLKILKFQISSKSLNKKIYF